MCNNCGHANKHHEKGWMCWCGCRKFDRYEPFEEYIERVADNSGKDEVANDDNN